MSTPLTIELFNESTTLDLQVNELTIKSAINELFEVSLSCGVPVGDDLLAKLDNYADFTLSINGDFGNPKFELELQSYDINYQPNTDIQILELKLTDRYAKFRKLDHKGAFYYHNLNDIWLKFYDGFKDRLNRKISDNILFDSNNTNKYPTHPIYVQYNETHWNFLTRTLLEHGVNYNFVAGQDGFNFIMYNTNEDITKFIQSDKSNSIDELYSYNLKLDANIKNKDDTVLAYNIIPAKSGYVANRDIKDFCNYHNKEKQRPILRPKKFIKNINFIHHNPYTPESFLISKATLDSKFPITQDFKSRFNTLTQSQLDECLNTQKNVLNSLDAEQLICNISKVLLLAGAKLDISGNNKLESREHIVTSSLVKLSASTSTDKVIGTTPKKNYNVITTLISQDIHIDYHQEAPEQPQISSLVGVFPYLAESSTNHDVVDPDDIGNVRVKLPLDYEVCPNNEKDIRYYVPRVSDYGDTNSSHSVQLYRESELLLMFIDGNPNKPIIYGALSHGQTSDQSMKDHHNRHVKEWGQGSGFGYSSDAKGTNDIFIKSQHNDGIAWVAQSNHGSKNELSLDQLFASTSNRSDTVTGEYQHFYGYDDNTNFAANQHKSIKPKTIVEDIQTVKQETLKAVTPTQTSTFTTYKLTKEELAEKQEKPVSIEYKDFLDREPEGMYLKHDRGTENSLAFNNNIANIIDESILGNHSQVCLVPSDIDILEDELKAKRENLSNLLNSLYEQSKIEAESHQSAYDDSSWYEKPFLLLAIGTVGISEGFYKSVAGMLEGAKDLALHPVDTAKDISKSAEEVVNIMSWIMRDEKTWGIILANGIRQLQLFDKYPIYGLEMGSRIIGGAATLVVAAMLTEGAAVALAATRVSGLLTEVSNLMVGIAKNISEISRKTIPVAKNFDKGVKVVVESKKPPIAKNVAETRLATASELAKSWQGKPPYDGIDRWKNISLKKGTKVISGHPGQSEYYTTMRSFDRVTGDTTKLWEGLQVKPHPKFGYRKQMAIYEVVEDTPSAFGTTKANPQFGKGGLPQIFVPQYSTNLKLIKVIDLK
ncbi:hypothetical protein [Francisella philomiragia]|uniref:hypothetical protein n=1 Tax=Francisella philomiragia TaxID=28110 RepID=UPI001904EF8E|nr:hypothetical protein [Francisella philomiragia]MBK2266495.1 hypothetical protein [Francisella philomiragia]MBK2278337.1 hypothetical protein [Francisella philomiragia]MBK2286193.1 hypothetical protein [Francisella philomiragia]MBK2287778.1 hypothetical protein [Francisella philomiragia]MBK2290152.1 hypothetical protein [Francisella philomiragia]